MTIYDTMETTRFQTLASVLELLLVSMQNLYRLPSLQYSFTSLNKEFSLLSVLDPGGVQAILHL